MNPLLTSFLSIRNESTEEQEYIAGLSDQFLQARDAGAYHLALFAYHLLYICIFYQTFHKIKIWFPEKHYMAVVSFDLDRRKKYREAINPTDYAYGKNHERSFFEFLNVICDCEPLVKRCKALVDYRNQRLGHVNYLLVSQDAFDNQIAEYDDVISEIHKLTHPRLATLFDEYEKSIDPSLILTKDELETGLIGPNLLSERDLQWLSTEFATRKSPMPIKVLDILRIDFGIDPLAV